MIIARNTMLLLVVGLIGVVGSLLAGFGCYAIGQEIALDQLCRSNLILARTLGLPGRDGELDHERLLDAWSRVDREGDGSYMCVVNRDGTLALNTKRPDKVGANVSAVVIPDGDIRSVGGLAEAAADWVGVNTNFSGFEQLAAYAYSEPLDAIVAVHRPESAFRAQVRSRVLPWALAGALFALLVIPGVLALFYTALRSSRREVADQRGQVEVLRERVLQLQRYESLDMVTRGVTHDLRGILQGILGAAESALSELEAHGGEGELLHSIETSVEHADELLGRLRNATVQESDEPCTADLERAAADALLILRPCTPRAIDLESEIEDGLPAVALQQVRVQQILLNLSLNALHAMRDFGGRLRITVERADADRVLLAVSDTGHGMDDVTQAQIFEPHFTTRASHGGSGLGLAVVQEIVGAAGGTIEVTSAPAEGTTFEVYLPVVPAARARAAARPARASHLNGTARSPRS